MGIFIIIVIVIVIIGFMVFATQKKKKGKDRYRDTPADPGETMTGTGDDKV